MRRIALLALLCWASSLHAEPYQAPFWLPGGHLQTIYAAKLVSLQAPNYRRERWDTPDGDFLDLDWVDGPAEAPLIVLFHGLEGSAQGHYAVSLMNAVRAQGLRGVVVHFRGCSGEPNRLPRAYYAGDATEIDWVLRQMRTRNPNTRIHAAGVSLGANALLKWLGDRGAAAQAVIQSAAAVSAPMDLAASGHALGRGFNRAVYTQAFLKSLKRKALDKLNRYPLLFDRERVVAAKTLYDFDDVVTAPLHGFKGTDDYWKRASSKPGLIHIQVPTLIISARNDPFMPAEALPKPEEISAQVTLRYSDSGGHVGFVSGPFPGHLTWLPQQLLGFFTAAR